MDNNEKQVESHDRYKMLFNKCNKLEDDLEKS
jgi:hypothetical protein